MRKIMNRRFASILALVLAVGGGSLLQVGCAEQEQDDERVSEQAVVDSSGFKLASEAEIETSNLEAFDALDHDAGILRGCSNRQISSAQSACRSNFCGTRGSNGIHYCDQKTTFVEAQCDCKTGADPVIRCSLTACPQ
jgi:hypothetical protein